MVEVAGLTALVVVLLAAFGMACALFGLLFVVHSLWLFLNLPCSCDKGENDWLEEADDWPNADADSRSEFVEGEIIEEVPSK